MPYSLDFYAPLPPRRPEFNEYDRNALAQMLAPRQMTPEEALAQRQAMMERFRQSMQFAQPGSMLGIRERQRIADTAIPESTFIDGRQYDRPQGPPMPFMMAVGGDRNALRQAIYPYLQDWGWAIDDQKR
jgi:hypothetical protein